MAGKFSGTPIFILREGSQRIVGREAQRSNVMTAKAVAGDGRTTLVPKGYDDLKDWWFHGIKIRRSGWDAWVKRHGRNGRPGLRVGLASISLLDFWISIIDL